MRYAMVSLFATLPAMTQQPRIRAGHAQDHPGRGAD
jgi:hypothetical protein